ncbi:MAG: helix-turn-helix transcriptional regulator [Oscillospiraceae bacterium]
MDRLRQDKNMGANLRLLRKGRGLTQEQVAAQLQVAGCDTTRAVYSRYETGELNIKVGDLVALRRILRCEYGDFFAGLE